MNEQGAPGRPRPDDAWWHTVYAGPAGTLPDTPAATADAGTVDDWFTTAAGLIGPQRTPVDAEPAPEPTPEPVPAAEDEPVPGPSPRSWAAAAWPELGKPAEPTPTLADLPTLPPEPEAAPPAPPAPPGPEPEAAPLAFEPQPGQEPERVAFEPHSEPGPAPVVFELQLQPEPEAVAAQPERAAPAVFEPQLQPEPEAVAPQPERAAPVVFEPQLQPEPEAVAPQPEPGPPPAVFEPQLQPEPEAVAAQPERAAPWRGRPETPAVPHVGERPPTYEAEPTALAPADPAGLTAVVPDTAIDGAQFAATTLRAVSIRGDSARYRGEPRRDALLTVRFGDAEDALVLTVLAAPARRANAQWGSAAAADATRQLAAAIGRSRAELAADLRTGARDRLRYGLQRIALQAAARLRSAAETEDPENSELPPEETASLHCLLMSTDPAATHRAAFGTGPGGLYLLRSGHWIDAYAARLLHHPDGQPPLPPAAMPTPRPFRFRLVPATSGDILLLCTPGLAAPIAEEPAVAHFLSSHWAHPHPPGTVDFLRQIQVRAKGYADDRTAAAVWTE
ncbi:protein phosphatase 2C domain-containing protein [Streptomyces sp. TLI_171]|uniref:protein phosphatase 2C domain-containing protein n=1 Tax=Streptomyces sp. TLI_171 TaxID=1938859 RepID=UPI000C17C9A8|nr:protein phosphatase 2C domain-containing protein [Streptomyces sp. TLI_171]RKE18502.1 protein phosphatase 2C-like protein [Streptomyces sp. TLI_171]